MRNTLRVVLPSVATVQETQGSLDEVSLAFEDIRDVDTLDLSDEGEETLVYFEYPLLTLRNHAFSYSFQNAVRTYYARIDRVEAVIIKKLKSRLDLATTANDMYRVFQRFIMLDFRPNVKAALGEYKSHFVEKVLDDIEKLQEHFNHPYKESSAFHCAVLRDIPPVGGAIAWAKHVHRRVEKLIDRVATVMGEGWEATEEGGKLVSVRDAFESSLDTDVLYERWLQEMESSDLEVKGLVFGVEEKPGGEGQLLLSVNFDLKLVTFFKEVRHLVALGYGVPVPLRLVAQQVQNVHLVAQTLTTTISAYNQALFMLPSLLSTLLVDSHDAVREQLAIGCALKWEAPELVSFARNLADVVEDYTSRVQMVVQEYDSIVSSVEVLKRCALQQDLLLQALTNIQGAVKRIVDERCTNVRQFVAALNDMLDGVLVCFALRGLGTRVTVWLLG